MSDTPDIPDFLPEGFGEDEIQKTPGFFFPDPDETARMSDIIGMVTGDGQVLTLEAARMAGGEPITGDEVEDLLPDQQAAFLHTEFTLAGMLALAQRDTPYPPGVDVTLESVIRKEFAERTEILVRLQRIRIRGEIRRIREEGPPGESDSGMLA